MIGESLAIVAVILAMAAMVARRGKHVFAAFSLPMLSIPVLHLAGRALGMPTLPWNIAGLAVGVVLCVLCSRYFHRRRSAVGYLVFSLVFLVALFGAYRLNLT